MNTLAHCFPTIKNHLINDNATIVVGLSGGPDSVFLLHYLVTVQKEKNLTLIAAHLDHQWRAESAQDAEFCKDLAQRYGVPLVVKTIADLQLSVKHNGSKEEMGRKARRYFFESVAKEYGASAIALAHHADDQMETFFIRMLRGASLSGLSGIKEKEKLYIRPLLTIKKNELLLYLDENKITYMTDASNQSHDYLRNRIRATVIPALQSADERFDHNFATTHAHLAQTEAFLQELAGTTLAILCDTHNHLAYEKLLSLHPVLQHRILINWLIAHKVPFIPSQGFFDEVLRFLHQPGNGQHTFYGTWQIKKNNGKLSITHLQS